MSKRKKYRVAAISIFIFGLLASVITLIQPDREAEAKLMTEYFINQDLVSPSSATYVHEEVKEIKENVWVVSGHVDSDNRFGVSLRSDYIVELEYDPEENMWYFDYISTNLF